MCVHATKKRERECAIVKEKQEKQAALECVLKRRYGCFYMACNKV